MHGHARPFDGSGSAPTEDRELQIATGASRCELAERLGQWGRYPKPRRTAPSLATSRAVKMSG